MNIKGNNDEWVPKDDWLTREGDDLQISWSVVLLPKYSRHTQFCLLTTSVNNNNNNNYQCMRSVQATWVTSAYAGAKVKMCMGYKGLVLESRHSRGGGMWSTREEKKEKQRKIQKGKEKKRRARMSTCQSMLLNGRVDRRVPALCDS